MHDAWFAFVFASTLTTSLASTVLAREPPSPSLASPSPALAVALALEPAPALATLSAALAQPTEQLYDPYHSGPPPTMRMLEEELRELERARGELSLAPPIITLAVGGGVLALSAGILLLAVLRDAVCRRDEDCGGGSSDKLYLFGGIGAVIGGAMAIVGLVTLIGRAGERRQLGRRIKEIRRELKGYPGYAMTLAPHPGGLSLKLRF